MPFDLRTVEDDFLEAIYRISQEEFHEALPLLARVVSFDPANASAYELWVACHLNLGRMERVIELADAGIVRGLPPAPLRVHKASALLALERYDESLETAQAALAEDKNLPNAVALIASAEAGRGNEDEALRIYQDAVRKWPGDEELYSLFLRLASNLRRTAVVREAAREYLRRFEPHPAVLEMLGHACASEGDFRRADRAFRDAARLAPDMAELHVNVVLLALRTGDENAFTSYLDRLARTNPEMVREVLEQARAIAARAGEAGAETES